MTSPTKLRPSTGTVALLLLFLALETDARMVHFFSYTTMMGLAAQSSRWKASMEKELTLLTEKSAESTALQEAAAEDQAAAEELTQKSLAEREGSTTLQGESDALHAKAEADEAKSAAAEEEADGLATDEAEKEAQSVGLLADASAKEALATDLEAEGVANAAIAAKDEAEADADEATVAACQLLPIIDVACDVVGGAAAVALQTQSVRLAAEAAESFTAAAAAQAEADSAAAEGAEMQAAAVEEGEQIAVLKSEVAALQSQAAEEVETAEADETAAKELGLESESDAEAAGEEETKALTDEDASAKSWMESVQHGTNACGSALMMTVASGVSVLFWAFRIGGSVVVPMVSSTCGYFTNVVCCPGTAKVATTSTTKLDFLLGSSYLFHHAMLFVLSFGVWGAALLRLRSMASVKAMGGTVLGFSATVAGSQSVALHCAPRLLQHDGTCLSHVWVGSCELIRRMIIIFPLVIMETLLVWVDAGRWVFVPQVVQIAQSYFLWGLVAASLAIHCACAARGRKCGREDVVRSDKGGDEAFDPSTGMVAPLIKVDALESGYGSLDVTVGEGESSVEEWEDADDWEPVEPEPEDAPLVSSDEDRLIDLKRKEQSFLQILLEDFRRFRLRLVFELLMASIILSFLLQSIPLLQKLWPASKAILLTAHPDWRLLSCLSVAAAVILLLCACLQ